MIGNKISLVLCFVLMDQWIAACVTGRLDDLDYAYDQDSGDNGEQEDLSGSHVKCDCRDDENTEGNSDYYDSMESSRNDGDSSYYDNTYGNRNDNAVGTEQGGNDGDSDYDGNYGSDESCTEETETEHENCSGENDCRYTTETTSTTTSSTTADYYDYHDYYDSNKDKENARVVQQQVNHPDEATESSSNQ